MTAAVAIPAAIQATSSIIGGVLSKGGNKETRMQRKQRKLVDQLLNSLNSDNGAYSDIFNFDEDAFQKSFVDPAKARFNNQIAPQIQQQYIANGLQRGSGLDDQLLRAGVDMDQMLNQNYLQFQENAKNRAFNGINSILNAGSGAQNNMSTGEALKQSTGGYLSSDAFANSVNSIFKNPQTANQRKGFTEG